MFRMDAFAPENRIDVTCSDDIPSAFLRGLYDFWQDKAGKRLCPSRCDLGPDEMKTWLGSISLLDVVDGGEDMIYRLAGIDVVDACGMEYRGLRLSEVDWGDRGRQIQEEYRQVARTARPLLVHSMLVSRNALFQARMVPKLTLPLSDDGATVSKLMTCFDFDPDGHIEERR